MLRTLTKLGVPIGIVMVVVMLVVPLPSVLLDLLIACNVTGALLILLVSMFVSRPLDFASFPSVILVMTLFRLALNVSATRPAPLVMTTNWITSRIANTIRPTISEPPTTKWPNVSITLPA